MRRALCLLSCALAGCGLSRDLEQYNAGSAGTTGNAGAGGGTAGGGSAGVAGSAGGSSGGGAGSAGTGGNAGSGSGGDGSGGTNTGGSSANGSGGATGGTGGSGVTLCGNGKLDEGEECDDGARADGDGCSGNCRVSCADIFGSAKEFETAGRVHCYAYEDGAGAWGEAAGKCSGLKGGHLVTIRDAAENNFVKSIVPASISRFWIGLTDKQPISSSLDDAYVWITTEPVTFTSWLSGEPNHLSGSCPGGCFEHRGAMQPTGGWSDRLETEKLPFVCEWEPPPLP